MVNMWRSWIPNSLSLGNLSFGFYSMIMAAQGASEGNPNAFFVSGLLILIAALFDGLDGPMARLLKVDGPLGAQIDSLADMTTFGLAPGYLMYSMFFKNILFPTPFGNFDFGMVIASLYPISAAYRLARFNVSHDTKHFSGLPSPIAAVVIALIPITFQNIEIPFMPVVIIFVTMSILMVSNVKYSKPQAEIKEHLNIIRIVLFVIIIGLLMYYLSWYWVVFAVLSLYIIGGVFAFSIHLIQKIRIRFDNN